MYGNSPWGYPPQYPQQPVVFIPPNPQPIADPVTQITQWQTALEQMKKAFKEEKKDDKKESKPGDMKVINIMLLMILVSPITGPIMSHFFQWGLSLLPH